MKITDEMLYKAAPEAAERWLAALPEREDCGHDFSLTFQAAMEPLLRRRRRRWRTLLLLAAVVAALGVLLAFGVSAERPDEYRVYAYQEDGLLSYRAMPKDDGSTQDFHQLTPEWVPEGFELTRANIREDRGTLAYSHRDDPDNYFYLNQWHGQDQDNTLLGHYRLEQVKISGEDALFFTDLDTQKSSLLWTQGADAFLLVGMGLEKEDFLHIAGNLKW